VREVLADLLTGQGEELFSEVLLVDASSGEILVGTAQSREGQRFAPVAEGEGQASGTIPLFDDTLFSQGTLAFTTLVRFQVPEPETPELFLSGISGTAQVEGLMRRLQVFSERRGGGRTVRGNSLLALKPDSLITLAPYAVTFETRTGVDHSVLSQTSVEGTGTLEYADASGQSVLGAYQWIPGWDLAVVVELPQEEVFAGLTSLAPFTGALIAGAIGLTLLVVAFTTNRMLQPLRTLTDFAERISGGDWHHRVPEDREDELGALASSLNRMAQELGTLYQSLETQVEARTRQIQTASEVARAVTSIPDLDQLLRRAVELIKERFGYDFVSIYLLDRAGETAVLREATGEAGQRLKDQGLSLEVGSDSSVGLVTAEQEPRVVNDLRAEPLREGNQRLPQTRSQATVPLHVGGAVLGALDVQSRHPGAFQEADLDVLQTLADQLSAAIENARLAQLSASSAERARLVSQITGELSGLLEPGEVLRKSAQALHRALPDAEIVVKLTPPEDPGALD
jgi:HAMP domain-containing protein